MSLSIIRTGILDTIQDTGRFGYQHLGINPTGAMDRDAARLANILVGNLPAEGVIELHFPASVFRFDHPAIIALTGADFSPRVEGQPFPLDTPVWLAAGTTLTFDHPHTGARCYMAVAGGLRIPLWLGSTSTHLKASAGGWHGRKLMKGDVIPFQHQIRRPYTARDVFIPLDDPMGRSVPEDSGIMILKGPEYSWLDDPSRSVFTSSSFTMSVQSDRMGFRLTGPSLYRCVEEELVSSPVTCGTIQLLPDGGMILLMADHQTTGGYPRIGQVITACRSSIAQKKPGELIRFQITDIQTAEAWQAEQHRHLAYLYQHYASRFASFF